MAESSQAPPVSPPPGPDLERPSGGASGAGEGSATTRLAVLDIGSNTVHVVVVDGRPDGTFTPVAEEREVLMLAEAAFPRMELPEEAIERLTSSVATLSRFATEHRADALVAFATSAIREASNGMQALGRVREVTGVPVRVLPGVEEARLTYVAARAWAGAGRRRLLILDIGGGSLEIGGGDEERPELVASLPLGVTRLTRRFLREDPPAESGLVALRVHGLNLLGEVADRVRERPWDLVCATSKTFRTLARVAEELPATESPSDRFGFAGVDGRTAPVLTAETINVLAGRLARSTRRQRSRMHGVSRLRAENVVAGRSWPRSPCRRSGSHTWCSRPGPCGKASSSTSCDARRARHPPPTRRPIPSGTPPCSTSAGATAGTSRTPGWSPTWPCHCSTRRVRFTSWGRGAAAALLLRPPPRRGSRGRAVGAPQALPVHHRERGPGRVHGTRAAPDGEHRPLSPSKALPAGHHSEYMALSDEDRRLVRRLGSLLRLADALDLDHYQLVERATLVADEDGLDLELEARDEPESALRSARELSDLFALEFDTVVTPVARRVD